MSDSLARQSELSAYIQAQAGAMKVEELVTLLGLHGQNASRIGRLLLAQRALTGGGDDKLAELMALALDEIEFE